MASLNPSTQYRHVILQVWETFRTKDVKKLQKILNMPEPLHGAEELRDICDTTGLLALGNVDNFIEIIDQLHLKKASLILRNFRRKCITQTAQLDEHCSVHGSKKLIFICLSCQERLCQDCKVLQHAKSCEVILTQEKYFEEINETYDQISKKVSPSEQIIADLHSKQMTYRQELYNNRRSVSRLLKKDHDDMIQAAKRVKSSLLNDISSHESSQTKKLLEIQVQLEDVNRIVRTTKDSSVILRDLPNRIKNAREKLKILDRVEKDLTESTELLRKGFTDISYSCNNNDGVFGEITLLKPYKITMIEEKNIFTKTETSGSFTKQLPLPTKLPVSKNRIKKTAKRSKGYVSTGFTITKMSTSPQTLPGSHNIMGTDDLSYQEDLDLDLDDVVPTTSGKSN